MTDSMQAARDDLAFLKAVADDKGPLPAQMGAHLMALGIVFGLQFIPNWLLFAGRAPWWPHDPWLLGTWLPGAIFYLAAAIAIHLFTTHAHVGPTARMFIAAWQAMAAMAWATVAVVIAASAKTGLPYYAVWPPLAFVLYGGAWFVAAIIRRELWYGAVAICCFIVAVISAALVNAAETWLVMSAGLVLLLAGPGAVIVRQARVAPRG